MVRRRVHACWRDRPVWRGRPGFDARHRARSLDGDCASFASTTGPRARSCASYCECAGSTRPCGRVGIVALRLSVVHAPCRQRYRLCLCSAHERRTSTHACSSTTVAVRRCRCLPLPCRLVPRGATLCPRELAALSRRDCVRTLRTARPCPICGGTAQAMRRSSVQGSRSRRRRASRHVCGCGCTRSSGSRTSCRRARRTGVLGVLTLGHFRPPQRGLPSDRVPRAGARGRATWRVGTIGAKRNTACCNSTRRDEWPSRTIER